MEVFPVEHITWGEVHVIHVLPDLTSRQDVVPHVEITQYPNKGLFCIKASSKGILLLAQNDRQCPRDLPGLDESLDGWTAVQP